MPQDRDATVHRKPEEPSRSASAPASDRSATARRTAGERSSPASPEGHSPLGDGNPSSERGIRGERGSSGPGSIPVEHRPPLAGPRSSDRLPDPDSGDGGSGSYAGLSGPPGAAELDEDGPSSSSAATIQLRPARIVSGERTVISKKAPPPASVALSPKASLEAGKLLEGEHLGHFRLEEYIGGGGMGSVYRAIDTTLGRTVAVKVVSREHTDEDTLRRFRNEAQSAARLDHPNIARVYFVGEDKGWSYIVFEYIEGVNIRDLVDHKGFLPLEEALSYTLDIAQALEHATRRDVVHRDIKPSNILVTSDGRAKLVDMGLARLHQVEAPSNDLTATGVTLGTFDYISPEQARDPRSADVRSDLYSLGCTLYYMLTGTAPFPEGTVLQKLLSHSSDPPPDPRLMRPDLPEDVTPLISKLLAKHPGQRYQTPYELMAAVLVVSKQHGLTLTPRAVPLVITSVPHASPWVTNHLPWMVPLGVFSALVLVLHFLSPPAPSIDRQLSRPRWQPQVASAALLDEGKSSSADSPRARERPVPSWPEGQSLPPDVRPAPVTPASPGEGPSSPPNPAPSAVPPSSPSAAAAGEEPFRSPDREPGGPTASPEPAATSPSSDHAVPPMAISGTAAAVNSPGKSNGNRSRPAASAKVATGESTEPSSKVHDPATEEVSPNRVIRKLVVDPQGGEIPADASVVSSLAAACREAATLTDVEEIELRLNESREEPIVLTAKRPLLIRAAEGYSPHLSFEAQVTSTAPIRTMVQVVGGQVTFEGIHFRLVFPYGTSEGWSLLYLNRVEQLAMRRCSMSIENPEQRHRVSFVAIEGKSLAAMMMPNQVQSSATTTRIDLDRCIARGQATFLSCEEGIPFWLSWRQGFLATTERFLETAGTADTRLVDPMRVELQRVFARVDRGLCGVQVEEGAPYQLELNFDLRNTVILHDESVPLVEHLGVESSERAMAKFGMRGEDNFYPNTKVRWRIQPKSADATEFSWDNRENQSWYKERLASQNVSWKHPPPADRTVERHVPADYSLSDLIGELAGCDERELPAIVPAQGSD